MMEFFGTMSGPDFLVIYFVWFAVTYGGVLICRSGGWDSPGVTVAGVALFEALGVLRFIAGLQHGMHRWNFLIGMMLLGGFIFFIRKSDLNSAGGGSAGGGSTGCGSSCSSSSSSCGGGGSSCGGGGCGGCGGS